VVPILTLELSVDWSHKRYPLWIRVFHQLLSFSFSSWMWSNCWWQRLIFLLLPKISGLIRIIPRLHKLYAVLTVLYCTILYYTMLCYTILYYTMLCYAMLCYAMLYYTILYYTILYYTILYYTVLYCTILYYTVLYCTILYYTVLYYTILYFTLLYFTILHFAILDKTRQTRQSPRAAKLCNWQRTDWIKRKEK
jgi:hypothetical protein